VNNLRTTCEQLENIGLHFATFPVLMRKRLRMAQNWLLKDRLCDTGV
jgi:hypothetical protein